MSQGMLLTNTGRNLIAKALTGKELHFTRALVGDGSLGSRDPKGLTSLISMKRELPIQRMSLTEYVGTAEVQLEMSNLNLTQGFYIREIGLMARDPDTGQEVLYSYCNKGNEAAYIEAYNGTDQIAFTLSLVTVVDQAKNVTAYITNATQYVTYSRLEQRFMDLYAPSGTPAGFWSYTQNDTQRIRPSTLEQTKFALWGDADITGFSSRLERVEDAVNQTMLALEMLQGTADFSHYIAEDFNNTSQLDMFSAKLLSVPAGSYFIECAVTEGLLAGSQYTITDGVRSEGVQVDYVYVKADRLRLMLNKPVVNSYTLSNARLVRTNAEIEQNHVIGPDARRRIDWAPNFVWKGLTENQNFSVYVETSLGNSEAFIQSGDAVLNNGGFVTLSV